MDQWRITGINKKVRQSISMRKLLQKLLRNPILWATNKFTSRPDKERIFKALSDLLKCILDGEKKKGLLIPFDIATGKIIIFSDQHKGARNGADDFLICEPNFLTALDYYYQNGFHYIGLGDCEELWENTILSIRKQQKPSFEKEKKSLLLRLFLILDVNLSFSCRQSKCRNFVC